MNDYLTLWTIQPIEWYEKLLHKKVIFGKKKLSENYNEECCGFKQAYDWLVVQMEKQISKKPFEDSLPIWAWAQYLNANKKRPDLRNSGHLLKGEKGVRIELRKKKTEVLLSDYFLWHQPLNYGYISDNDEDDKHFNSLLEVYSVKYTDKEKYPHHIIKKIENSWSKIFDIDYYTEHTTNLSVIKAIQATFWSLSVNEIIKVDKFIGR